MILGRTPSGAIKTKTDGGLRAVNCACCVSQCGCFSLPSNSIIIPSDPDFAKKLRGDSGVTAFSQVSVSFNVSYDDGYDIVSGSGSFNVGWIADDYCADFGIKKFADFPRTFGIPTCGIDPSSGSGDVTPNISVLMSDNNCLVVYLDDDNYGNGFSLSKGLTEPPCNLPAPENTGQVSITINGVPMLTQFAPFDGIWYSEYTLTGSFTIIFS